MLFAGPHLTSVRDGGIDVPAGAVVAFDGTVAEAAALTGWAICDGNGDALDLTDRVIGGAGGAAVLGAQWGASEDQITGTTSTDGAHVVGGSGGATSGSGASNANPSGSGGEHDHVLSGSVSPWQPPAREALFVKATATARLPAKAVVWAATPSAPGGYAVFGDLIGRTLVGVASDSREQVGSLTKTATVAVLDAGGHNHPFSKYGVTGGGAQTNGQGGLHPHADIVESVDVPFPPFIALTPVVTVSETGALKGVVLAYDGDPAALPDDWALCDGGDGRPLIQDGRIVVGAGGAFDVGDTGGTETATTVDTAVSSATITHDHIAGATPQSGSVGDHYSYDWTHGHATASLSIDHRPPSHALHHITPA